ncbi:MAG: universal stress protein [Devosia nanyangense]|uniref:Universal stress protein n=1 Tax=Devosia nanyangense TaxID=1228055 RepID=A0A933L835_9HYPH|nr:universal stress protein [Devosia nanyangense]
MPFSFAMPLLTYPDPTPTGGFARALDLAATLGGRLTALVEETDIPDINNVLAELLIDVPAMAAAAEARSRANGAELVATLSHQAERLALPLEVERVRSRPELAPDAIAHAARTHDFALLLSPDANDEHAAMVEAVLFGSGGPVIVFSGTDGPAHLETVAVAWDGSRSAARALRDAMPVLALAGRTVILTERDDKPIDPASVDKVRRLLESHSIGSFHVEVAPGPESVGESLQHAALAQDAGLLVMGAYGHTRLREFVLGGATRAVLASPKLAVLMSH